MLSFLMHLLSKILNQENECNILFAALSPLHSLYAPGFWKVMKDKRISYPTKLCTNVYVCTSGDTHGATLVHAYHQFLNLQATKLFTVTSATKGVGYHPPKI